MPSSISSLSGSESFCECSLCKYKLVEPYPFYPTVCTPIVCFAEMRHGKEQKQKQDKKRNLFLRAFHWYTEEHRHQNSTATTSTSEVKETWKKDDDVSAFADWLDLKYQQFRQQKPDNSNVCCERQVVTTNTVVCEQVSIQQNDMYNPSITKKKLSKFTKGQTNSMEYILEPKNMSRMVSECCHPIPTSNPSMNMEDKIKPSKTEIPPMEQQSKPLVEQKSYVIEPASELHANNESAFEEKFKKENLKSALKEPSAVEHYSATKTAKEEMPMSASKEPSKIAQLNKKRKHNDVICQCEKFTKTNKGEDAVKSEASTQHVTESKEVQIQYQEQPIPIPWTVPTTQSATSRQEPQPLLSRPVCPSFQKPCPSFGKVASGQTNPCPSLLQPCPGKRPCPTLHGPCFLPPLEVENTVTERQPSLNTKDVQESPSKSEPPVNPAISSSFQKPTYSISKPASKLAAPCPSLQQACPAKRRCPTLRGPCPNPNKINDAFSQKQPPLNLMSSQMSSSKLNQPMNPKPCPNFHEPCPSFYKHVSETIAPCPSLQQPCLPDQRHAPCYYNRPNTGMMQLQPQIAPCPNLRPQCPGLYGPLDPRFLYYGNNCICQGTIPPPQYIRREICLQSFCKQCADNCGTNAFNENVARPSAPVPHYTMVEQSSVERNFKITSKTGCIPVICQGVSTKPSSADLACQTSDHSIRLDKETIDYPFFMKIVCADRLKQ